ncbi:MAG: VWA domain-containing protein [Acidimicrobiales bacterium]
MAAVEEVVVAMARTLRGLGLRTPPDASVAFAAALAEVGLARRSSVYWAGRSTLVRRPEDIGTYDRAFAAVFDGLVEADRDQEAHATAETVTLLVDSDQDPLATGPPDEVVEGPTCSLRWSDREVLRHQDFSKCTVAELDEAHRLMADIRLVGSRRRSRRLRPSRRPSGPLDLRATTRLALRTGGEPLRTVHRRAGHRPRRIVLLCDISGSMEAYARALVRFAQVAVVGRAQVEVFTLGTRCSRVTRELRSRDPDAAMAAVAGVVDDWSGGTRLGAGLHAFNQTWGVRGLARGADVVILSDGWDRGDPALLGEEVQRLRRVAHRLVWVNPLKATPGFAPLAGGMAAALPHVDDLVEGHSLASLEALVEVLAR